MAPEGSHPYLVPAWPSRGALELAGALGDTQALEAGWRAWRSCCSAGRGGSKDPDTRAQGEGRGERAGTKEAKLGSWVWRPPRWQHVLSQEELGAEPSPGEGKKKGKEVPLSEGLYSLSSLPYPAKSLFPSSWLVCFSSASSGMSFLGSRLQSGCKYCCLLSCPLHLFTGHLARIPRSVLCLFI